jgi:hypothetical protein
MAIKTFTTGEVLTASDTNTYLANSGLVFIKQQTIGNAVSSIPVTSAFSTDYDNYRIVISKTTVSAVGNSAGITINGSTGATYSSSGIYMTPTSGTVNGLALNQVASGFWLGITGDVWSGAFDVMSPFLGAVTNFYGQSGGSGGGSYYNTTMSADSNAASSTGFTIVQASSNWTGGTITVFGYRKS